jgi:AcrR family transcriptional regulator
VKTASRQAFQPRKTPLPKRSALTVEAIAEATIQVLLALGSDRLATTRVPERAGVSVGTLYQYYPNKQALLYPALGAPGIKVPRRSRTLAIYAGASRCWLRRRWRRS